MQLFEQKFLDYIKGGSKDKEVNPLSILKSLKSPTKLLVSFEDIVRSYDNIEMMYDPDDKTKYSDGTEIPNKDGLDKGYVHFEDKSGRSKTVSINKIKNIFKI